MKKGSVNSRQFHGSVENSKITLQYNMLFKEYSKQQKVYVSNKKKLQVEKQKREILLEEVRFLRQRFLCLIKSQCAKVEPELDPHQNSDINYMSIKKKVNHSVKKAYIEQKGKRSMKKLVRKKPSKEKKPMNFSMNEKKSGKRITVNLKVSCSFDSNDPSPKEDDLGKPNGKEDNATPATLQNMPKRTIQKPASWDEYIH